METQIYNQKGKSVGKFELPESIFGVPWNGDLVHQVVTAMQANARTPVAHTKTRGEVRGGGKKPWKQKGTGRARHGSTRSPIWKGGGVTHGPRNDKVYDQKINKKMKAKALYTVLSEKLRKGQLIFVEELNLKAIKTKDAVAVMKDLSGIKGFERMVGGKKPNTYISVPAKGDVLKKSFANIPTVEIDEVRNMNPVDLLAYRYIIISQPTESVAFLGGKTEKK
ncbi:50S ribosomal protein L4 [Candidatus Nomurabacteria bacterium RIFOXYC2_FULL_36_8]|nr:MAG: 50S ribosomal protein L4 [Candidatus Nomurabacteria bacterium GW2011_GWD2_36_14]KKP99369.1 MAG: 50S ribosomal protein L4 [Candidatus Nomurabacteria bacterium GW2011_GWF2_36_19]KKQ09507.1 MAG: 50S ribosomal protein L4 [Candidatus Nomurabacteria bacterium GW2011_GWB1_36_6]KKQ12376.1 MAG: 50S ribosomal protein L4 [Candidatus Nomurabacteria bacterium GW2011_GWE1_36_71]KKQ19794.1 MAG: 50S ribosomal protein L4 [Candidatus Nomurabacteria bacterium GW2011_GWC2_36_9]KKQ44842.1 MAG: 50S ribosoma